MPAVHLASCPDPDPDPSAASPTRASLCAGATLGSFVIALLHFSLELLLFKTLGLATAVQPMIVAGAAAAATACGQGGSHASAGAGPAAGSEPARRVQARPARAGVPRRPTAAHGACPLPRSPPGVSTLWMGLGWNYYTAYASRAEPTMSEDITVTQKDD